MSTEQGRFSGTIDFTKRAAEKLRSLTYINTTLRAILATILGIVLIFQPEKTRPLLVSFMGGFWLASGLLSLRWSGRNRRYRRLGLIFGFVGIITGLAVIARHFMGRYIAEMVIVNLLAVLMILTGLIHIGKGPVGYVEDSHRWSKTAPFLGIIEIVLGTLLLIAQDLNFSPIIYHLISLWAFMGGIILFGDAFYQRRQAKIELERSSFEAEQNGNRVKDR
jgi:uncharacterized membrane protein HdeD (DUF308 family)